MPAKSKASKLRVVLTAFENESLANSEFQVDIDLEVLKKRVQNGKRLWWQVVLTEMKPYLTTRAELVEHMDYLLDKICEHQFSRNSRPQDLFAGRHMDATSASYFEGYKDIQVAWGTFAAKVPHGSLEVPGSKALLVEYKKNNCQISLNAALLPEGQQFEYFVSNVEKQSRVFVPTRGHFQILGRRVDKKQVTTGDKRARHVQARNVHSSIARNLWSSHKTVKQPCRDQFAIVLMTNLTSEYSFYSVFV